MVKCEDHSATSTLTPKDTKTSRVAGKRFYDDQTLGSGGEETTFRIINRQRLELVNRCVCLSTIFRNLSFVPGNDVELCKHASLLKILARLLVFKHTHKVVVSVVASDSEMDEDNGDESEDDSNLDYLDEEFECIKEMKDKNLFYDTRCSTQSKQTWVI